MLDRVALGSDAEETDHADHGISHTREPGPPPRAGSPCRPSDRHAPPDRGGRAPPPAAPRWARLAERARARRRPRPPRPPEAEPRLAERGDDGGGRLAHVAAELHRGVAVVRRGPLRDERDAPAGVARHSG